MKRFKLFVIVGMLVSLTVGAVPTMAANTGNSSISNVYVSGKEGESSTRYKENTTKVYVYYYSGMPQVKVRTYGVSSSGTKVNKTNGGAAYVGRNDHSSITNGIYEAGYRHAKLGLTSTQSQYYGYLARGVWSPDSSQNYKVVN